MLKLTERECLIKALTLTKDKTRQLNKAFGDDIPNRAYTEWQELTDTIDYLESKLTDLNRKEHPNEYKNSYS